ncbi:hypothetical protein [Nostoc sp. T09]|nr:hypothetical protein [Nostoc sp. T09]
MRSPSLDRILFEVRNFSIGFDSTGKSTEVWRKGDNLWNIGS